MDYGAIDLHTRQSEIRIVNGRGQVRLERRIDTRPVALTRLFAGRPRLRILIESGTESAWVAEHLEALGHELVVVDPNYTPMYGTRARRIKTDKRDVAALAEANRLGIFRRAHRRSPTQRAVSRELQTRDALVQMRTQAINVIRTQVRSLGYRVSSGAAETVAARVGALALPAALQATLAPLVAMLETLTPLIATATRALTAIATADPVTRRLMTVPGVGPVTALQYRTTIDDIRRFPSAGAVSAYLGLVPREASSGERQRKGAMTKSGPSRPRAALVQAAWVVWRMPRGPARALHAWVHRLAARRGKKVAIVALARRLTRILFAIWRDGRPFDPTRLTAVAA